jgi:octaheme c-type cytochrome (tetrathionate reductase family)
MRSRKGILAIGISLIALASLGVVIASVSRTSGRAVENPTAHLRVRKPHTDHKALLKGPFADGPSVTRACLGCHFDSAHEVMATSHWSWLGQEVNVPGHEQAMRIGKMNLVNNFCIGAKPNIAHCSSCHAGYGWVDSTFDFSKQENVDCLVCHDTLGSYQKDHEHGGIPAEGVDLTAVAQGVGLPTRHNCGVCHFAGAGGDAVKHGDLDGTMYFPTERIDVHMGKLNFDCQECHRTKNHQIPGRSMSVSVDDSNRVACTDCHSQTPHREERLDNHTKTVACQTCHIPKMAIEAATQMAWDWSTAGHGPPPGIDPSFYSKTAATVHCLVGPQDAHGVIDSRLYSKTRGSFVYAKDVIPEYYWYNGTADRNLLGDKIDPEKITRINYPRGSAPDPRARIWPFKVHRGKQPYDTVNKHLLTPRTSGQGGYWTTFNWDQSFRLGSEDTGLAYSGKFDFAATEMYWPLSHMVATRDKALQCVDCHGEGGRMNWKALGYDGDPAFRGSRAPMLFSRDHTETQP